LRELVRTNDAVLISALIANLRASGIEAMVFDAHASILDGSISAVPRRIMVGDGDYVRAKDILEALENSTR
jgi:hypothetical protein